MRKPLLFLFALALLMPVLFVKAQNYDDPAVYMKAINNTQGDFTKTYLAYISAAWHSTRAAKIDRLRQQVVTNLTTCRYKLIDLPYYKHDNSLRQANIDYLWLLTKIYNDDYSHLVNMEELIDQSYDKMELYLSFQERINDTLRLANEKMGQAEKDFAVKYNVQLTSNKTEVAQKMEDGNKVRKYRNRVFLFFFKCAWQESLVMDAIEKKNMVKLEQARSALLNYATDGLAGVDTVANFTNDAALATAAKQALDFYKQEAETSLPKISGFLLADENFTKIKSSFDAKGKNAAKEDTDAYNKAMNDTKAAYIAAAAAMKTTVAARNKALDNYAKVEQKFIDDHMPYYR